MYACLYIDTINKCQASYCENIVIGNPICVASFTYTKDDSLNTFNLTNTSMGSITGYYWVLSNRVCLHHKKNSLMYLIIMVIMKKFSC
jgi:PKD repeat protein